MKMSQKRKIQFRPTIKQSQAFDAFINPDIREIVFGGGAGGCVVSNTPVLTNQGYKQIKDIEVGDIVATLNEQTKAMEWKPVEKTFVYPIGKTSKDMVQCTLYDGTTITTTTDHKCYQNGKWVAIGDIAKRAVAEFSAEVRSIKYGEGSINELQELQQNKTTKTSELSRLSKNSTKQKNTTNPQNSGGGMDTKPREQNTSKSQKLQPVGQPSRKLGMGNTKRKLFILLKGWTFERFSRKTKGKGKQQWSKRIKNWHINPKRAKGKGNQETVATLQGDERNTSKGIRSNTGLYKGCCNAQELEAHNIKYVAYPEKQTVYDLQVKDNHNYCATKNNYIIHNSKSYLGCAIGIIYSLRYTGIRGFIGRESGTDLRNTTLNTFFDVAKSWGLKRDVDYIYNYQQGLITFPTTGSTIMLKEMKYYPKDPNFDSFGSLELTWAWIDEAQQVKKKAKDILGSRIRYKLKENNLSPTFLMTCNPAKNWLYTDYYKPYKEGTLPSDTLFIEALVTDNPHIDPTYIETLKKLPLAERERLLYGNWEYDNDPATMIEYDTIVDMFTNTVKLGENPTRYMAVDVARHGVDKTTIWIWKGGEEGLKTMRITEIPKNNIDELVRIIQKQAETYRVPRSHIVIDEGGVGGGVVDFLPGAVAFNASFSPYDKGYINLKAECGYKLAEMANQHKLAIRVDEGDELKNKIIQEIEQLKTMDQDKDGKKKIMPKDKIKEKIGHSPDHLDNLIMLMVFFVRPQISLSF